MQTLSRIAKPSITTGETTSWNIGAAVVAALAFGIMMQMMSAPISGAGQKDRRT